MPTPNNIPNIFGNFDSRDLDTPVIEIPQPDIYDQIVEVLAFYRDLSNDIIGVLAGRTTVAKEYFQFSEGGNHNGLLQQRSEYTNAYATRPALEGNVGTFDVGYPIYRFGDRAMWTPEYLLRATLRDINNKTFDALIKDYNTLFRYTLNAIFQKTNYTFFDDNVIGQGFGNVGVKRLLNADGGDEIVFVDGEQVETGTLNHYKTSGTAALTNATFTMARDTLAAVGLDGDIVFFLSKTDATYVSENLTDFVPANYPPDQDPYVRDFMSIDEKNAYVRPPYAIVKSPRAIGRMRNSGEVVVIPWMPNGYMIAMDRASERPLVIRECDLASLQGFRLTAADNMNPQLGGDKLIVNKMWERIFGVGVRNRANGVVVQVTTNVNYAAPDFGI